MTTISLTLSTQTIKRSKILFSKYLPFVLIGLLLVISILAFLYFYSSGLNLAYNDARSRLDIGRRVVEGLKPGLAQLGSVWLPLPHVLMVPTVWHDFMWHSGLSGALYSMISFVVTAMIIYQLLRQIGVGVFGRLFGVLVFVANLNILYLQTTAMTELLLLATMTKGVYELLVWHKNDGIEHFVKASFWIMLSTLVRYDGWFLLFWATLLILIRGFRRGGYAKSEGLFFFFCTLGGLGVFLWLLWNAAIFGDPLYFAFGSFSAHAQQAQLEEAGVLATKGNLWLSLKLYWYAMVYNSVLTTVILGIVGQIVFWFDTKITAEIKMAATALLAPLVFNIVALYLGHSVLFIQGLSGNSWFNVRYGIMMMPSLAFFAGYLVDKLKPMRWTILGLFCFVTLFHFANYDSVTIDDGTVGSSQKNVTEVSGWLNSNAKNTEGLVLISAASHDAIIFSSGLPMKKFIHEGTGEYWESATATPDHWARWIIMRTHDDNDLTYRLVSKSKGMKNYNLVQSFPFADIYELDDRYLDRLQFEELNK